MIESFLNDPSFHKINNFQNFRERMNKKIQEVNQDEDLNEFEDEIDTFEMKDKEFS